MRREIEDVRCSVVCNPEFLREGTAVEDFMQPDRMVVGADDARALQTMHRLYLPLLREPYQWMPMDLRAAELTKYACNAMLATRVSVMNELALLAEQMQVDIEDIRRGMAGDPRIGGRHLAPGCGFGGPCLPKDLRMLQRAAAELEVAVPTLTGVERTNLRLKGLLAQRVIELFGGSLVGRRVALWGLAFKPGTDDLREAPSETLITALVAAGARVVAHDPVAMPAARRRFANLRALSFAADSLHAVDAADALLIVTEWAEYRRVDWSVVRARMAGPHVLDGRNLCDPRQMAELGFNYRGIGRKRFANIAASSPKAAVENPMAPVIPGGIAAAPSPPRSAFSRA
jgi:UDPglucose 6-dehydrogenase